jgi:uncharacterized membrane protein HdeD (DUF308 family)
VNTFASTHSAPLSTRRETGWSIFMGIILMVAGFAAIWVPFAAGLAGTIFFGSLVLVSGIAHLVYAWFERKGGGVFWQILIGLIYFIAGVTMLLLPVNAVFALTLVLACYIAIEGVLELAFFLWLRLLPGSVWFLVDGIISLLLSILIFMGWPSSSRWAVGTLVGVSLLFSGVARITLPMLMLRPRPAIAA